LQCVAVCCSVLQCVAVCCSVLQCVAVCCSVLQCLQCVAVCCSVLQCVAQRQPHVCCIKAPSIDVHALSHPPFTYALHCTAPPCNTVQHTRARTVSYTAGGTHNVAHRTLQHTATLCNTLQHSALMGERSAHNVAHHTLQHTTPHHMAPTIDVVVGCCSDSVLQCVAVCYSVLQCVAVCCWAGHARRELPSVALRELPSVAVHAAYRT